MSDISPEDRELMDEYYAALKSRFDRATLADARRWKARQQGGPLPKPPRRLWRRPLYQWGLLALLFFVASLVVTWAETYPERWNMCGSECRIEQRLERIEELLRRQLVR
jgi:hypothetical protein